MYNIARRVSIIIPIIYIFLLYLLSHLVNNGYFLFIGLFITISILFWNIPFFVTVLHTTPVYYEDIVLISNAIDTNIHKLQNVFTTLNALFTSAFITITIFYIYTYHQINNYSYIEILAIIGGLGSINLRIQAVFGKALLTILYGIKKRNNKVISLPILGYDNPSINQSVDISMNSINPSIYDISNNHYQYESDIGTITPISHISSPNNRFIYMDDISRMTNRSVISTLWDRRNRGSPINGGLSDLLSINISN